MWLLVPYLIGLCAATFTNDFTSYPAGSQQCLYRAAADSQCVADTGAQMNYCLCRNNGNFVYATARCVAKQSPSDLQTVYAVLVSNCAGTGTTMVVSQDAFLAQAAAATAAGSTVAVATSSTTSLKAAAASQTSTPASMAQTSTQIATNQASTQTANTQATTQKADGESGDVSTVAKIGIGVGIGFGMAAGLVGAFFYLYRRRWKQSESLRQDHKLESGESLGSLEEPKASRTSFTTSTTPTTRQPYTAELSTTEAVELPAGTYPIYELPAPSEPIEMPLESPRSGPSGASRWHESPVAASADGTPQQDVPLPQYTPSPMSGYSSPYPTFASVSVTNLSISSHQDEPDQKTR